MIKVYREKTGYTTVKEASLLLFVCISEQTKRCL